MVSDSTGYVPPRVWTWEKPAGGSFAGTNRPIAGPTHDEELPVGERPLQLYSSATPNGEKVAIMLEELLALGRSGAAYDAWLIEIGEGDQFSSGFVEVSPNSMTPALMDRSGPSPIRIFESGAILIHLAETFDAFLPGLRPARTETLSWLFWLTGAAPSLGGGFGHFYACAPTRQEYPINRYAIEVKRQLDVLDRRLADNEFVAGADYTIADMAIWPWYGGLVKGWLYGAAEFLSVQEYANVVRWADQILARPAVARARLVSHASESPSSVLHQRHVAAIHLRHRHATEVRGERA